MAGKGERKKFTVPTGDVVDKLTPELVKNGSEGKLKERGVFVIERED